MACKCRWLETEVHEIIREKISAYNVCFTIPIEPGEKLLQNVMSSTEGPVKKKAEMKTRKKATLLNNDGGKER